MLKLVKPSEKYKKSFIAAMREFKQEEWRKNLNVEELESDFPAFLKKMSDYEKGKNLPKGYVPASYYWLVDRSGFIGETTVRHKLTPALRKIGGHIGYGIRPTKRKRGYGTKILALALKKAKNLGIKRALVTCDDDNVGSWKIIEANGGVLKDKIRDKKKMKRRYWVKIR